MSNYLRYLSRRRAQNVLNEFRSARIVNAEEAQRLLVFNPQNLSPAFSTYLNNLSVQTFNTPIQCGDWCLYVVYTNTAKATMDMINNDPDTYFAGVYTIIKRPEMTYYEIYNVITNPAMRGQGIARKMIKQGMKILKETLDPNAIFWLAVDPDNPFFEQAVKSYSNNGFTYPSVSSKSPSLLFDWKKGMVAMTTDLPEPSPNHTVERANKLRMYIQQSNIQLTVRISINSIKELYEYNVRNSTETGMYEMGGYFTTDTTTGVASIDSYEPLPATISNNVLRSPEEFQTLYQVYNAVWGTNESSRIPTTKQIGWHTHPWLVYAPDSLLLIDFPSHSDMVSSLVYFITAPLRLHIVFSYDLIYYMQLSRSFSAVIKYILNNQSISLLQDIAGVIKEYLEKLYITNVAPLNILENKYVANIVNDILDLWCNITLDRVITAYSQSTDPTIRRAVDSLEELMSINEVLFYISSVKYKKIVNNSTLDINYYAG